MPDSPFTRTPTERDLRQDLLLAGVMLVGGVISAGLSTVAGLYGKTQARPGRKMGHLTALADTPAEAVDKVIRARRSLTRAGAAAPAFPTSVS